VANICLDLDGVVADLVAGINKELDVRGLSDFDYAHWIVGVFEDDLTREIFGSPVFWKNLRPFVDSWYAVNDWWGVGHEVFFVTARYSDVSRRWVRPWLDMWNFQYSDVFFAEMGSKAEVVSRLGCEVMVEDNPYEVRALRDAGVDCLLMRAWYNSQFWEDVPSVGSLLEVVVDA
jgi:hypothetical protein